MKEFEFFLDGVSHKVRASNLAAAAAALIAAWRDADDAALGDAPPTSWFTFDGSGDIDTCNIDVSPEVRVHEEG
jgi:hypothetical protein